jgi:hypothetical protein
VLVVCKLDNFFNFSCTAGKAVKDGVEVSTLLHRNNTELILFVNPDEEGLFLVVEDTTAVGPVAVEVAGFEESVSFPKKN